MQQVDILYFAWVREAVGIDAERLEIEPQSMTVADMIAQLVQRSEGHARAFADPSRLRCAVDQVMAGLDAPLGGAREVAFFPPVTGG